MIHLNVAIYQGGKKIGIAKYVQEKRMGKRTLVGETVV